MAEILEVHRKQNMFILNLDIRNYQKIGCYSLKNFNVPGPFPQVSLQGPKSFVLGDNLPHSEKNLEHTEKSYIFACFWQITICQKRRIQNS